jgi:hypothetical protein
MDIVTSLFLQAFKYFSEIIQGVSHVQVVNTLNFLYVSWFKCMVGVISDLLSMVFYWTYVF